MHDPRGPLLGHVDTAELEDLERQVVSSTGIARWQALRQAAGHQAWIVWGLNDGRVDSNVAMSSAWLSVMPTSSSPSSSRQRV
jgi:hypothetical protein